MKKLFVAVAVVLMAGCFTACDEDKVNCYEVTRTSVVLGTETSTTFTMCATKNEIEAYKTSTEVKIGNNTTSISYKKVSKSNCNCQSEEK